MKLCNLIKIVLSALFLLCLIDLPYGFYQFVRFIALIGFGILAYQAYQTERQKEFYVYLALAILFQPIIKIYLGRTIWNTVDIVVSIGLLLSFFIKKNKI
ncbi:hypothetical protein OBK28_13275 [Empedobacter falsenii]|uniref:DUF2809 domain-containing protein n=1 Tax=Empedobacter falsenii TaxID=343874 RepID=A0ABY8VAI2_9FLAO|nr:DUF6804 family protein [Empedobacter falsenii]WIH96550.1 hypothetical protein OBA43_09750 [Empedobacter falsenii]